jgi:hypothetical protein
MAVGKLKHFNRTESSSLLYRNDYLLTGQVSDYAVLRNTIPCVSNNEKDVQYTRKPNKCTHCDRWRRQRTDRMIDQLVLMAVTKTDFSAWRSSFLGSDGCFETTLSRLKAVLTTALQVFWDAKPCRLVMLRANQRNVMPLNSGSISQKWTGTTGYPRRRWLFSTRQDVSSPRDLYLQLTNETYIFAYVPALISSFLVNLLYPLPCAKNSPLASPCVFLVQDIPLCLKFNNKMKFNMYSVWHNYLYYFSMTDTDISVNCNWVDTRWQ